MYQVHLRLYIKTFSKYFLEPSHRLDGDLLKKRALPFGKGRADLPASVEPEDVVQKVH